MPLRKKNSGFTIIELMIVLVLIFILAALAIPRFMGALERSTMKVQQSEAKQVLREIYTMQRTYHNQNPSNCYGDQGLTVSAGENFPQIGVQIPTTSIYEYSMVAAEIEFIATATANLDDDATIDTWTIDEKGVLSHTIDDILN